MRLKIGKATKKQDVLALGEQVRFFLLLRDPSVVMTLILAAQLGKL